MGLTHWGRDNMSNIFQTTFSNAFSWMKMFEFRFHWSLFSMVKLTIWHIGSDNGLAPTRRQAIIWTNDVRSSTHICVTRPQWVLNKAGRHLADYFKCTFLNDWNSPKFVPKGSTENQSLLVQVMAWCLRCHYLNQSWQRYMTSYSVIRQQVIEKEKCLSGWQKPSFSTYFGYISSDFTAGTLTSMISLP